MQLYENIFKAVSIMTEALTEWMVNEDIQVDNFDSGGVANASWRICCFGLAQVAKAGALAARDFGERSVAAIPVLVRDQAPPTHESPNTRSSHWV